MGIFKRKSTLNKKSALDRDSKINFEFTVPDRTLDDFAGYEALREEGQKRLLQAIQNFFLRGTDSYVRTLLEGVGGVGKSYFASCLAGEATRMILLNKKIEERMNVDLSDTVRPEIEKKFLINPKDPKYQKPLGKFLYLLDKLCDGTTPDLINNKIKDFETTLKTYKDMLFNNVDVPGKEEFNQKVKNSYLKRLIALGKKEGFFSDDEKELEARLKLDDIEKVIVQKKSKDSAFEELILENYSKHEKDLRKKVEEEYHKNLAQSIVTEILEYDPNSEIGQASIKKYSSKSIEELEKDLGDTKPREVIATRKKAWTSVIGLPQSKKDTVANVTVNGADFAKLYVGAGTINVENLFKETRKKRDEHAAVVLNIEELDALGTDRTRGENDERRATLSRLLQEMGTDSDKLNQGIMIIASTNLAQMLDPAIVRSGRFGKPIKVDIPTEKDLKEIIKYHFSQLKLDPDVDLGLLAVELYGSTGADIDELKNESQILAQMKKRTSVCDEDVRSAMYRVLLGLAANVEFTDKDKELIAYHEAGHALAIERLNKYKEVAELVLKSYGATGAFIRDRLREDRPKMLSRRDFLDGLVADYAGIIAEEEIFGKDEASFGAEMDIIKATEKMKRGLRSGILGDTYLNFGNERVDEDFITKKTQEVAHKVVDETRKFIKNNISYLKAIKEIGIVRGRLSGEEVKAICNLDEKYLSKVSSTVKEGCSEKEYFDLIHGKVDLKEY